MLLLGMTYILNRPCIYCSLLLIILFASSCHWSNRCFVDFSSINNSSTPHDASPMSWLVPRLYTASTSSHSAPTSTDPSVPTGDMSAFMSEIVNTTIVGLAGVVKDSAAGVLDEFRQRVAAANTSSVPGEVGVGTQWLRNLLGRSEWTLPCVNIKIVL